jgi:hypothetical protein
MYWKAQLPFLNIVFCEQQDATSTSYLLLITRNFELQKIYLGVTREDLKSIASKRRLSIDNKLKQADAAKE